MDELTLVQMYYVESNYNNFQNYTTFRDASSSNFLSTNVLMLRNRIPLIIKVSCYLSMSVFISQREKNHPNHIQNPPTRWYNRKYLVQMYDDD